MGIFFNRNKNKAETTSEEFEQLVQEVEAYQNRINAELFAEFVVVDYIAKNFAKSKIIFNENGKRLKGEEFYRWNIKPNDFQTAYELKYEIASQLLLNNEVLIFEKSNSLIVADGGFSVERKGLNPFVFSDISKNDTSFVDVFNSNDVIYLKYERNGILQKLGTLLSGLQELINTAAKNYEKTENERAILEMESAELGDKNRQEAIKKFLDERFKKFFESKGNAVMPIFKGMKYHDLNDDRSATKRSEIPDINEVVDEIIAKAAIAHGIRPSSILGDKENTTVADRNTLSNAVKPIAELLEEGINASGIIGKENFKNGRYAEVDLTPLTYTTIFDNAEASDMLLRSSQYSIDELREAVGKEPLNTWWSTRHWRTLNNELIPLEEKNSDKGGDK